jgi:hypothetical protein
MVRVRGNSITGETGRPVTRESHVKSRQPTPANRPSANCVSNAKWPEVRVQFIVGQTLQAPAMVLMHGRGV